MNTLIVSFAAALIPFISIASISQLSKNIESKECTQWVDSVYNTLSERERVEQLIIATVTPAHRESSRNLIRKYVEDDHVGGLLFSEGDSENFSVMTNYAQSIANVPLLMTLDGEWGPSMRVKDAPRFPHNMGLGAIQDHTLLYEYGKEVARECKALGIHVDFAPVLDVNSNPDNPVIGYRSFGENPHKVAELGTAFSLGMEAGGVMAVGKHFPGHGDTNSDSHKTLPQVNRSKQMLDTVELIPFKRFINAGCNGIMVGHIALPAYDKSRKPASMSKKITTDLLKNKLGFKGLIFTDGLGMKGAAVKGSNCVAALQAGADMLLGPKDVTKEVDEILKAIKKGKISKQSIEERCKKVLAYKYLLGLTTDTPIDTANIYSQLNSPQADALNRRLADASITILRNTDNVLPIGDLGHNNIAIVNIGEKENNEFDEFCSKYAKCDVFNSASLNQAKLKALASFNTVIAAVYNDDNASINALSSLKNTHNLIAVFFVNPYKMAKFKNALDNAKAITLAYDDTPYTREAAAKAIFGGINVDGKLPVNLKGFASMGDGIELKKSRLGYSSAAAHGINDSIVEKIDSIIDDALLCGAFPGGQLIVAKGGDIIIERNFGTTTEGGEEVTRNTLYDLASVSKAVGTLPGVMKAYDLGLFEMDEPASKHIPGLNIKGKDDITPRNLLFHETGIRPALDVFSMMMDSASYTGRLYLSKPDEIHTLKVYDGLYADPNAKLRTDILSTKKTDTFNHEAAKGIWVGKVTYDSIMNRIYNSPVRNNRNFVYSCLNFALLMDLEQHVTGIDHDVWVTDSVWAPIGAYGFCYRPTENRPDFSVAWTENDVLMRRQHLHGYAHDELAAMSGGVQGNAGVFGTATDIAKLCQLWLNDGQYGDARVYTPETSILFTTEKTPNSRRGLGFDKPDTENLDNSPCCDEAGPKVYGHTGFTGTCFWVDPEHELIYVFLSNRVDPTRSNRAFARASVRPKIMSLLYEALEN